MDTENVNVKIEAITTGLQAGLKNAQSYMKSFASGMKDELKVMSDESKASMKTYESSFEQLGNVFQERFKGMNGAIKGVQIAWAQLAVVVAAGAFAAKMVNDTMKMTVESQKLGRALGINATQASVLAIAIGDVYGTTDQYVGMVKGMGRVLKTNEEAMNAMGLVTRDSNGALKDQQTLVMDGLTVLSKYKEGTDRNLAATTLFGRGVDVTSEMLNLNAEKLELAREKADDLNLALDQDGVAASNNYRAAINDAQDGIAGMTKAVGDALMPVMTDLINMFADIAPAAIVVIRGALGGLLSVFHGLMLSIKVMWSLFVAFFKSVGDIGTAFAGILKAVFTGDYDAALAARAQLFSSLKENASSAFESIVADATSTRDKLSNLFVNSGAVEDSNKGKKNYEGEDKDDGAAAKAAKEAAAAAKAALAEKQRMLKEEFEAFKQEKALELEETSKSYDEKLRIAREVLEKAKALFGAESTEYRKAALDIVKIENAKAAAIQRIQDIIADGAREQSLAQIAAAEDTADFELAIGNQTLQGRMQQQIGFEEQRYTIELEYLDSRIAMMDTESEAYAAALVEREKLTAEHSARLTTIARESALERMAPELQMTAQTKQYAADTLASLMTGQMTLRNSAALMTKEMLGSFTKYLSQKLAASKIFAAAEIAVNKAIAVVLRVLGFTSAATAISSKSTETTAKIGQSAAAAGAGAAESQASIPYIGPILAIAAMAAIFAAVMGMKSKASGSVPSAAGGFDIPMGMNPLTQLHEQEMVLPKEQAEAIRSMTGDGGGAIHINVSAIDGDSVKRFFMENKNHLATAARAAVRSGLK